MIPFNRAALTGNEEKYLLESIKSFKMAGNGEFSIKCQKWFEENLPCKKSLLTPSCTHALEMAAILIGIKPGDEVIMPSYTFVSTANAFVLRGAKIVFVDIRPDTMNLDEKLIENAITNKTKAIVPVHYAGVSCEMDMIMGIAEKYNLFVIEDAAQGLLSTYKDKQLGIMGHLGAFSFHETKNLTSGGEGGLLIINDEKFKDRAEIIREKGTNRTRFFMGLTDKYSWIDIGSSYLMNDLSAAYLWGQLELAAHITENRLASWKLYYEFLATQKNLELPNIPGTVKHNGHMFYIKVKDLEERTNLIDHLFTNEISAVFHYVPLHSSKAGLKYSEFNGEDKFTTRESERLLRLPLYYNMAKEDIIKITNKIKEFFN
jgi:dTDP-4-amino-4,6-dideoxygalactose transaminase